MGMGLKRYRPIWDWFKAMDIQLVPEDKDLHSVVKHRAGFVTGNWRFYLRGMAGGGL